MFEIQEIDGRFYIQHVESKKWFKNFFLTHDDADEEVFYLLDFFDDEDLEDWTLSHNLATETT